MYKLNYKELWMQSINKPTGKELLEQHIKLWRGFTHEVPEEVGCFGCVQETYYLLGQGLLHTDWDKCLPGAHQQVDEQVDSVTLDVLVWETEAINQAMQYRLYNTSIIQQKYRLHKYKHCTTKYSHDIYLLLLWMTYCSTQRNNCLLEGTKD